MDVSAVLRRRATAASVSESYETIKRPASVSDFRQCNDDARLLLVGHPRPPTNAQRIICSNSKEQTPTAERAEGTGPIRRKSDRQSICLTGGFLALSPPVNKNAGNVGGSCNDVAAFGGSYLSLTSPVNRRVHQSSKSKGKSRPHSYACDGQPATAVGDQQHNNKQQQQQKDRRRPASGLYSIREDEDGNNNSSSVNNTSCSPAALTSASTSSWSLL